MHRHARWLMAFGGLGLSAGLVLRRFLRAMHTVPDDVLLRRVESRVANAVRDARRVSVMACRGYVTLQGSVDADEVLPLCKAVAAVPGVEYVENRCCRPTDPLGKATLPER